jgi:hypothetical protein
MNLNEVLEQVQSLTAITSTLAEKVDALTVIVTGGKPAEPDVPASSPAKKAPAKKAAKAPDTPSAESDVPAQTAAEAVADSSAEPTPPAE